MAHDGFRVGDRLAIAIKRKRVIRIPKEKELEDGVSSNKSNSRTGLDKRKSI